MIYRHCVMQIHDCATNIVVKEIEKLLKFKNEKEADEHDFKVVQDLEKDGFQYPGNGRIYVDYLTRDLTPDEISFCGLPD